jgi:BMFP domain-containing protein YqiC
MKLPAYLLWIFGSVLLSFAACQENKVVSIEEEKLIDILIDMHIAEAASQKLYGEAKDSVTNVYYDQIFDLHEVPRETFEVYMEELGADPQRLQALYEKVIDKMARLEAGLEDNQ